MSLTEIRWHGRGGQGVKTAATMVAEIAMEGGMYTQGFPEYGPERSGAPVRGFTRVSDTEVRIHSAIEEPDIVIVLDESLLTAGGIINGLKKNGVFLVNTKASPAEIRKRTGLQGAKVYTLDAQEIALKTIGRPIPNIPLVGAMAKITGILTADTLKVAIKKKFGKKFSEKVVEGNIKAIEMSFNEVKGE